MRRAVGAALAVIALAGCGQRGIIAVPAGEVSGETSPAPTPATVDGYTPAPPVPAVCGPDGGLGLGHGPVEAALGSRYLFVEVLNCGSDPVELPARPEVVARTPDGWTLPVEWTYREPDRPLLLAGGDSATLALHWHSSGRCERGADRIEVWINGQLIQVRDCLQLGGLAEQTGEADAGEVGWEPA